jgi:uncharacterized protein YkuJ
VFFEIEKMESTFEVESICAVQYSQFQQVFTRRRRKGISCKLGKQKYQQITL